MITVLHRYVGVFWPMITVYHESWVIISIDLTKNSYFSVGKKSFLGGYVKIYFLHSQMITVLHRRGYAQMIIILHKGAGVSREHVCQ